MTQGLARGHALTLLVRPHSSAAERPGVRILSGGLEDAALVDRALQGAEAVLSCIGMQRRNPANPWPADAPLEGRRRRTPASRVRPPSGKRCTQSPSRSRSRRNTTPGWDSPQPRTTGTQRPALKRTPRSASPKKLSASAAPQRTSS
ncbi:MAG: NAD(P)H-binding protein [Deltaproteobacteria bacterium]|nr:NAD(P)H-binding protein [Deltaproteobacteria bacterium]